jgi:hypothetical protein
MAFTERMATRTHTSGSAIAQFTFVSLAADGQVDNTAANLRTDGVALMGAVGAGEAITVAYDGRVTVQAGGTIARGAAVAVGTAGKAKAAAATNVIVGFALEAGVDGQIITVELSRADKAAV